MPKPVLIYTVEVDGKPTLTFAGNTREAAELLKEPWFRSELLELTSNGVPICKLASILKPRIADEAEIARYQAAAKMAGSTGRRLHRRGRGQGHVAGGRRAAAAVAGTGGGRDPAGAEAIAIWLRDQGISRTPLSARRFKS